MPCEIPVSFLILQSCWFTPGSHMEATDSEIPEICSYCGKNIFINGT